MNSINVKMEKANAIFEYRRLQRITTLFRFVEIFVFLIVISTFSSNLPFSVRISTNHLRGISFGFFSPRFVFVIGNVIVLILLFKYRVAENGDQYGKIDVYDEYIKRCEKNVVNSTTDIVASKERKIWRSQSDKLMRVECKGSQSHQKLTRSLTERKMLKKLDCGGGEIAVPEKSCAKDELSGEDFRRTVEAFIARQQQSLRDEQLAPIPYVGFKVTE